MIQILSATVSVNTYQWQVLDSFFLKVKKVEPWQRFLITYANHLTYWQNLTTLLFNQCRVIINTFWWSYWNLDVIPAYSSTSTCYTAMIAGTVARKMKQDISWNDWWIPEVDSRQFLLTHSLETQTFDKRVTISFPCPMCHTPCALSELI